MSKSWVTGVAAVGVAAMALAACGSSSHQATGTTPTTATHTTGPGATVPSPSTTAPKAVEPTGHAIDGTLAASYRHTISAGSARLAMQITTTTPTGISVPINFSGVERWKPTLASFSLHFPPVLAQSFGSSVLQERYVGAVVYVSLPSKARVISDGKPWLGLTGLASGASSTFGENPLETLELLQAESTSVTKVGPATVDGVATTEYRADVNLDKALAAAPPSLRTLLHGIAQHSSISVLPLTAYIDGQGRLREMVERETLRPSATSAAGASGPIQTKLVIRLSDYGVPVHVSAPAQASTFEVPFSQFAKLISQG